VLFTATQKVVVTHEIDVMVVEASNVVSDDQPDPL